MKSFILWAISLYQSKVSPLKGFSCAHHQLHGEDTCSNAVKKLIAQRGVVASLPAIVARFKDCRQAFEFLSEARSSKLPKPSNKSDLAIPCDLPCDASFGECGGAGTDKPGGLCIAPCGFGSGDRYSRKNQVYGLYGFFLILLVLAYFVYGREVSSITIERGENGNSSILSKLFTRDVPKIRVMLQVGGKKYYSRATTIEDSGNRYILKMDSGPLNYSIDKLEIQDARLSVGGDLLVVGQILESIENPASKGEGEKFKYDIKRRWHFY